MFGLKLTFIKAVGLSKQEVAEVGEHKIFALYVFTDNNNSNNV